MINDNFKHIDPDEFHGKELTLHDCMSDKISFENHTLRFYLPDGFWVTSHHTENTSEKIIRTDASVVDFSIADIDDKRDILEEHIIEAISYRKNINGEVI